MVYLLCVLKCHYPLFVSSLVNLARFRIMSKTQVSDRGIIWNTDLIEAIELENLLVNSVSTIHSAEQVIVFHLTGFAASIF